MIIAIIRRPALRLTDDGFDEDILHEYNSVRWEFQENPKGDQISFRFAVQGIGLRALSVWRKFETLILTHGDLRINL